jgi:hypothetical protein
MGLASEVNGPLILVSGEQVFFPEELSELTRTRIEGHFPLVRRRLRFLRVVFILAIRQAMKIFSPKSLTTVQLLVSHHRERPLKKDVSSRVIGFWQDLPKQRV